jgi:integrase
MSRQEAETGSPASEYLTVAELAKMVRRNRKTVYGWISTGEIGEADGLFVVQGRFLIHWPTFRTRQFKPLQKLRGQVPDFSEETENGVARNGQTRSITDRVKYYDGRTYREPLGVEASKRTRVDAERLSSTIQLELSAGTFDYAKRFPNSERTKKLGLKPPEQRSNQTLKEFAEAAWLPEKRLEVKRSTFVYYNEIYKPHIEKAEIGKKLLSEINDEDINLWKLEIEGKRTPQKKPLSTRRKNMSLDVLCQILRLAKRRGLANDKLLIDARPFKNEENEDEVSPFTEDEVESLIKASEGWERSLLSVCFFTGMRRGEVLGLRWSGVFFDRDRILVRRSLTRHGESSPKSKTSFRYVQMLPRVREELLKQRDRIKLRSEFVFPNRAWKALNVNWVTKALWPRLVEKAEVPYRPLMQTRHTYATLMLQKGAPIDWLQKQMGHRNLTMLIVTIGAGSIQAS